jgi:hypothetical protein
MSRTTLAESLSAVFSRLHVAPPNSSLWNSWRFIFSGLGVSQYVHIGGIATVAEGLERLQNQVDASANLKSNQKVSANTTLGLLRPFLDFGTLHQSIEPIRNNCRPEICGNLSFLGSGLASEYGEAALEPADAQTIKDLLVELLTVLEGSTIDLDLRLALRQQISGLIWWVSNPEIVSVQQLFQRFGESMVLVGQIDERSGAGDAETRAKSRTIFERAQSAFRIVAQLACGADKAFRVADELSIESQHIVDAVRQIT